MFAVIAGRDSEKIEAGMRPQFSVLIMRGRTGWMGDCSARRIWMMFPVLIKRIIRCTR